MDAGIQNLILGFVAALGGGGLVGWIAKVAIANYIKNNDQKHVESRKDHKEISDKVGEIKTDIAVINTKLDRINGVGDKVIVLEQTMEKHSKDIDAAHNRIRSVEQ